MTIRARTSNLLPAEPVLDPHADDPASLEHQGGHLAVVGDGRAGASGGPHQGPHEPGRVVELAVVEDAGPGQPFLMSSGNHSSTLLRETIPAAGSGGRVGDPPVPVRGQAFNRVNAAPSVSAPRIPCP